MRIIVTNVSLNTYKRKMYKVQGLKLVLMKVFIMTFILGWCMVGGIVAQQTPDDDTIIAPNVFTPNGDGINDVFEVRSKEGNKVALKIFTRAGVLLFEIEAERCRWDGYSLSGQKMPTGVYFYTAQIIGSSSKSSRKNGFVHLYR